MTGIKTWATGLVLAATLLAPAAFADDAEPPRRAAIREQARGLLAARLKSDVGLSDAQIADVLPKIEGIEEGRRQAQRNRMRLLSELRRGINQGASDADLQASLDALDRGERDQDRRTRETLARIDGALSVPQRVRLRFLLVRFRGEITRELETIRGGRRGAR